MPITGYKEVAANLRLMAAAATPAARKRARKKALQPVIETAKQILRANGNVETAALVNKVGVGDGRKENESLAGARRGRRGRFNRVSSRYQHLVEFGTAPHYQPNRFGGFMHPGARPYPHMRPAFEQHKAGIAKAYFGEIWTTIARAVK